MPAATEAILARVPAESPSGRHVALVLVCLSAMPVPLSDIGVETGVAGDSFPETKQCQMFGSRKAGSLPAAGRASIRRRDRGEGSG